MGRDIRIVVETRSEQGWKHALEVQLDHEATQRNYSLFDHLVFNDDRSVLGKKGLPPDADPGFMRDHPDWGALFQSVGARPPSRLDLADLLGDYGYSHGTVAQLRAADWGPCESSGFVRWIRTGGGLDQMVQQHGPEGVRVLVGFNG